jgi:hypothetical protein
VPSGAEIHIGSLRVISISWPETFPPEEWDRLADQQQHATDVRQESGRDVANPGGIAGIRLLLMLFA